MRLRIVYGHLGDDSDDFARPNAASDSRVEDETAGGLALAVVEDVEVALDLVVVVVVLEVPATIDDANDASKAEN
mgnify:CR=1 FL=1